ncbi:TonB-dependent receptor plug domain-containing protein [Hymenobacter chitinivorans]|uniref:Hemoglobin/transferrin/lactoferrin receptor protein n=1 Tax=Hymenobacter chitinivorans DSM 11115 TaxID=1121954 RepID=A0A2M9B9X7_9BACT|nr:TonB-dependent receptor [Hymenobacter chitinivorans]PJJ54744.1 hemoglobin/transferrin/lactoferrin receptor protein [Hymenobacter chitinivorans DSM 11115]
MKKSIPFVLASLFGAEEVEAQSTRPDTLRAISLSEVVVSANRVQERKADIPQQIDVLPAAQIRLQNPMNTADALQNTGQVFVQKSQFGGGSPVIRGFEANKILLVIDGVRMNNAIYRAGHLQNILTTDANAVDRIEVLSGAGSVIYGTDALGGVISILTKNPRLADSTTATQPRVGMSSFVRYGTAAKEKTAHTDLSLGWRKFGSLTSITASDFDDLRKGRRDYKSFPGFGENLRYVERQDGKDVVVPNDNVNIQRESGYRQLGVLQKFLYRPSATQQHTLNVQYSTTSNVPRYDRLQEYRNGNLRFAEWNYGPEKRFFASYQFQYSRPTAFFDMVRFTPAVQKVNESRLSRAFGNVNRDENLEEVKIGSVNLDLFKQIGRHELRYGAEATRNKVESVGRRVNIDNGATIGIATRYPTGSTYATTGVYASHNWEITPQLILSDGLRFSTVKLKANFNPEFFKSSLLNSDQKSSSLNGNLGLVWMLPVGFRVSGLVSTGFRNPNLDDVSKTFEQNNGTLIVPNPDLKPEQIFYREAEVSQTIEGKLHVAVTGFYSTLTDAIVVRPYTAPDGSTTTVYNGQPFTTVANTNANKARVYGFSGRFNAALLNHWSTQASVTYTKGRVLTTDVPLDHIPPVYGRGAITYQNRKLTAEASMLFNGRKGLADYSPSGEDNLGQNTPVGALGWQTFNLRTTYQITRSWSVQSGLENILDQSYRPFASGINAAGRNFYLTVRFER